MCVCSAIPLSCDSPLPPRDQQPSQPAAANSSHHPYSRRDRGEGCRLWLGIKLGSLWPRELLVVTVECGSREAFHPRATLRHQVIPAVANAHLSTQLPPESLVILKSRVPGVALSCRRVFIRRRSPFASGRPAAARLLLSVSPRVGVSTAEKTIGLLLPGATHLSAKPYPGPRRSSSRSTIRFLLS